MTDEKRYVHCGTHGQVQPAFACAHLVEQLLQQRFSFIGWFESEVDPSRREWGDLNGWCKVCDDVLLEEGEWNDRSEGFARIKMICEHCFARIRDVQRELDRTDHFRS